jgi:hypothetical protein
MEKVKNRDTQFELVVFSQQVLDKAIATRLSFAQRESNNYQALEYELPNLWEVAQKSYQRKAWKIVLSFQDALRPFLDRRGYWSRSLKPGKGMAGVKSGFACLEDDIYSGSASPGNPSLSTATRSSAISTTSAKNQNPKVCRLLQ